MGGFIFREQNVLALWAEMNCRYSGKRWCWLNSRAVISANSWAVLSGNSREQSNPRAVISTSSWTVVSAFICFTIAPTQWHRPRWSEAKNSAMFDIMWWMMMIRKKLHSVITSLVKYTMKLIKIRKYVVCSFLVVKCFGDGEIGIYKIL